MTSTDGMLLRLLAHTDNDLLTLSSSKTEFSSLNSNSKFKDRSDLVKDQSASVSSVLRTEMTEA